MYCTFKILHTIDIMHMTLYIGHCCMFQFFPGYVGHSLWNRHECKLCYIYNIMILLKWVIFVLRMH